MPPKPRRATRAKAAALLQEEEYVAMDELTQTLPRPANPPSNEEEEEEEEAEADPDDPDVSGSDSESSPSPSPSPSPSTSPKRPQRLAAQAARANVSSWTGSGSGGGSGNRASSAVSSQPALKALPSKAPPPASSSSTAAAASSAISTSPRKKTADDDVLPEDGDGLQSPDGLPVYGKKALTFAAAEQLLLVPDATHEGKTTVCKSIPVFCPPTQGGFTFLIDAANLYKIEDIPVDGYGSWTAGGSRASSRSRYYVQMQNGDLMRVDSTIKHNREPAHWDLKLTQTRYVHPACDRNFRKLTYCVRDREGGVKRWAAVTYQWLCEPFSFTPLPHGNCKGGKKEVRPFQRTYPSVLAAMKQQLPLRMPKSVLEDIQTARGEQPIPAMPRNRKQLYNLNREAIKETGQPIDHRKWRKTGPAAGQPPGALELYLEGTSEEGLDMDDVQYVLEDSAVPGIPDNQLTILQQAAEALVADPEAWPSTNDPSAIPLRDNSLIYTLKRDMDVPGAIRCSKRCEEFRAFQHLCQHTMALALRTGGESALATHLDYARAQCAPEIQFLPHHIVLAPDQVVVAEDFPQGVVLQEEH